MNLLDVRRALLADPRRIAPQVQDALEKDASLAALRDQVLRLDDEVRGALAAPEVPDGLAARLVLHARYRERSRWRLALAASVAALAFGLALAITLVPGAAADQEAMMEHVAQGAGELRDDSGVEPAALHAAVMALGVDVRSAGYRVRHLANCVVAGREGRHFTVDGPSGVVTFLVLPSGTRGGPEWIERSGLKARFIRRAGATIGIFAEARMDSAEMEGMLRRVVS